MPASYRQLFRGIHRPQRLPQLRLGQDWEMEVRPLSLTPQPVKVVQNKAKDPTASSPYGTQQP